MDEQWRDVIGYEGYYQVSNLGRIRSMDRVIPHVSFGTCKRKGQLRCLRPTDRGGHLAVDLSKNGNQRTILVHRLVAAAWIGPRPDGQQVRHGPNGVSDNSVSNLCYGTLSENQKDRRRDGTHRGRRVRRSDGVEFINMHVAAEETGCRYSHIWDVCNGRRKTAGSYGWEYV